MNTYENNRYVVTSRWMGSCRVVAVSLLVVIATGCQSSGTHSDRGANARRASARGDGQRIVRVRCIYTQKPWLNLDAAGDRDPEGIGFRVFLDPGKGRCILREGTFHIEMYQISRKNNELIERILISDWHYDASDFTTVDSKILGFGYHLRLRWATKDVANKEIELIVRFEDNFGNSARSGTKRFRVPKYVS